MGNYTIFRRFENPRRGIQATNLTTNVPKNSRSQTIFRTDSFQKLLLGASEIRGLETVKKYNLTFLLRGGGGVQALQI